MEQKVNDLNDRELRMQLVAALYVEMTKMGKPAASIIQDVILFEKYIKTGERP